MQAMMKPWQHWMGSVAALNKLVSQGARLTPEDNLVKPNNVVTNGPYVELKELVSGNSVVKAIDRGSLFVVTRRSRTTNNFTVVKDGLIPHVEDTNGHPIFSPSSS
jgi:hypothetical protein